MYLVTIINDGVETAINEVSTNTNNRIIGNIKQGINTIDSFDFTIYPNNVGYELITPFSTLIKVLNTKTNKYEFIGRVLSPTYEMDDSGLISKSYICESELGYLLDTYQSYEEIHNISVKNFLEKLIQNHNKNTDTSKRFTIGNVTVVDNNDSLYKYIAYDTTKKNIDDDLISKLGGELQVRYENGVRYLDYLTEIGTICNTEIRLTKNLQSIERVSDITQYCNRLIVLGTKLEVTGENEEKVQSEKRLTIEKVNNGKTYIDDAESISKYGIIQGQVIFDDVTDVNILLTKGQKHLLNQRILVSNRVSALDLSLIGIDIDSFEVGNYYPLIHELLGINDIVRVVEKTISIDSPYSTSITLGDLEKDIKSYYLNTKKQLNKIDSLEIDISSQSALLNSVGDATNKNAQSLTTLTEEVLKLGNNSTETINSMLQSIQLLSENMTIINNNLTTIHNELTTINNRLTEMNNRIISLETTSTTLEGRITALENPEGGE